MPYTFTVIPDYVFDQVLTFTNMNTLKDNQEAIHDSFSEEHEFSSGDHERISEAMNHVFNPDARMGSAGYYDGGASADYNQPGVDTDQALSFAAPNFTAVPWTNAFAHGSYFTIVPASAELIDLGEEIALGPSVAIVLSFQASLLNFSAGNVYVDVVCYDAGGNYQGIICQKAFASGTDIALWTTFEVAGTTLANGVGGATADTAYIRPRMWIDGSAVADFFSVTRLSIQRGLVARYFVDETAPKYVSARWHMTGGTQTGTIATATTTVVDFNSGDWDDPGTNRVVPDDGGANRWRYTADRYQKLRVSARIEGSLTGSSLGAGEETWLSIRKNGALWSRLDYIIGDVITIPQPGANYSLQGSDTIELDKGEFLDIIFRQDSGGNYSFNVGQPGYNYVSIEEI
jgi:hypothetical protein